MSSAKWVCYGIMVTLTFFAFDVGLEAGFEAGLDAGFDRGLAADAGACNGFRRDSINLLSRLIKQKHAPSSTRAWSSMQGQPWWQRSSLRGLSLWQQQLWPLRQGWCQSQPKNDPRQQALVG